MADSGEWQILKVDEDYEIFTKPPHAIRRIGSDKIVGEHIQQDNGYVRLKLNKKKFYKHRILAIQFISNPDNLPQVDHINRIRTDNRIENLRFVSNLQNSNNRSITSRGRNVEYVEELPVKAIEVQKYGKHEYEDLYFYDNKFYKWNGLQYRVIPLILLKNGKYIIVARDTNNKKHHIHYTKFKRENGLE